MHWSGKPPTIRHANSVDGCSVGLTVLRMSTMEYTSASGNTVSGPVAARSMYGDSLEARGFHHAVGGEFVDDEIDESDLIGGELCIVK